MSWRIAADLREMFIELAATNGEETFFCQSLNRKDLLTSGLGDALNSLPPGAKESAKFRFHSDIERVSLREEWVNPVALLTTEGFENIFEIGSQTRLNTFGFQPVKARSLIGLEFCFGVTERTNSLGQPEVPLDEKEIDFVVSKLRSSGVQAVAICFLHSNKNPAHENQLAKKLEQNGFKAFCSYLYEGNELKRATLASAAALTSQANALLLDEIQKLGFLKENISAESHFSLKNRATGVHITLLEDRTVVSFSGSSSLIEEIGVCGLSTFEIDDLGLVHAGLHSIGSEPGPIAFGKGLKLCLIDALVIGKSLRFSDMSKLKIDPIRALRQVAPLAKQLQLSPEAACVHFFDLAVSTMASQIRTLAAKARVNITDSSVFLDGWMAPLFEKALKEKLRPVQMSVSNKSQWSLALSLDNDFLIAPTFSERGKLNYA